MKNVTSAFRKELRKDSRTYIKSCDITLSDGTVLNIGNASIWSNGFKIDDDVSGSGSFDIGAAIIGKFTLVLNNIYDDFSGYDFTDAIISNVKVGLKLPDDTVESVKKGVFAVDEPTYNGSIITLECLDNMSKFDRPYSESKLIYPATLGAIVRDACSCCGVSLAADSAAFDGCDIVIPERPDGDDSYTFRQVLSWAGQISCHWCRCNENGELSLGWYDTEQYEKLSQICDGGTFNPWSEGDAVDGGTLNPWSAGDALDGGAFKDFNKYHHIYSISSRTVSTDDVVITGVRVVKESSEGDNTVYQSGTEGYVLSIEENRFIQGDMGSTVAASLGEKLIGLRFRPLSVSCLSDPSIEAGDIAAVSDRKGNTYFTLITSTTFQAGNYQKVSCDAETPSRNSASRFSKATQVYRELRRNLSKQKTEWEKAVDDLGKRMDNAGGLYPTEEKQDDGSTIYYFHDKPTLAESKVVFKMTNQAIAISTDGGKTWPTGVTVDGVAVAKILNTIGVNASWINSGALTVKDADGNIIFLADVESGRVEIAPDSFSLHGKTVEEIAQGKLNDFVSSTYNSDIANLQAQIDGQIETFYYDYEPTLSNIPASQWTTEEDRQKHEGDLFYYKSKGYAYRFFKDGSTWKWQLVRDTDVTKALADAAEAQDTADKKRRVFLTTPVPPYDNGDLWATSTTSGQAGIKICTTSRASGSYVSSDWIDPKYVDSDSVNSAISNYDTALGQTEIYNKLTNNGLIQGIYLKDGRIYINATYINTGILAGWTIDKANQRITSPNGKIIIDAKNEKITTVSNTQGYKTEIAPGEITTGDLEAGGRANIGYGTFGSGFGNSYLNIGDENNGGSSEIQISGCFRASNNNFEVEKQALFIKPPKIFNLTHVSSGGHLVFASDGATLAYLDASSRRYKDIDRPMTDEDVENMYNLPVVWAKYKDGRLSKDDERCGKLMPMFIAEDVDGVFPLAADHKNGQVEDWNYRIMIPLMFQMLKAQKHEIEELKKKLEQ